MYFFFLSPPIYFISLFISFSISFFLSLSSPLSLFLLSLHVFSCFFLTQSLSHSLLFTASISIRTYTFLFLSRPEHCVLYYSIAFSLLCILSPSPYLLLPSYTLKMGQSRPLFVYFHHFHMTQFKYNLKKRRWCGWDSNPGWHDGRQRWIRWAMAAPLQAISFSMSFFSLSLCVCDFKRERNETKNWAADLVAKTRSCIAFWLCRPHTTLFCLCQWFAHSHQHCSCSHRKDTFNNET